ncbi:hypothetical protein, partial [Persicitalea sp.]|uniref:hypothetical protein n=1 Tax=Persicitalea sp. TaxID=3100273 RepID=UPI00359309FF
SQKGVLDPENREDSPTQAYDFSTCEESVGAWAKQKLDKLTPISKNARLKFGIRSAWILKWNGFLNAKGIANYLPETKPDFIRLM